MSGLGAVLSIAESGLSAIQLQLSLVSQNVANANTSGYTAETAGQESLQTGGAASGVKALLPQATTDAALAAAVLTQNAQVAADTTQQGALQPIIQVSGTVGSGNDLSSLVGDVQDAFSTLLNDPSNSAQQQDVVTTAQTLTTALNQQSQAVQQARQTAQNTIVSQVGTLNTDLAQIGTLNAQIANQNAAGQSTATLQNQLNATLQNMSSLVSIQTMAQTNGTVVVATQSGTILPTDGTQITTAAATMSPQSGAAPPITLDGIDITAQLTGGSIGANITLRDQTLPGFQAGLDEFSETLATRFSAQGLTLFTDAQGNVPAGGGTPVQSTYLGFASEIQVNPYVLANPTAVRDGTWAIAGSPTGASAFTPNPSGGPSGFTTLIDRVLTYALGSDVQAGVAQQGANTTGLGASGTLSVAPSADQSLTGIATTLTSSQAATSNAVTQNLTSAQSLQTSVTNMLSSATSVNMDTEMSSMIALQNSYGANAKIVTAMQSMFDAILQAVTS
jgi:flagellar hook-associated protein 1